MNKIKIAIVEDDMIIADDIGLMLEGLGYELIWHASRYTAALDKLDQQRPDLLLLDIQLGGKLDGIHLAQVIKEQYGIPFIFLTANADTGTIERAKKVNPMAYLTKPVTSSLVYSAIEIALNNYNKVQAVNTNGSSGTQTRDSIFVKDGNQYRKINFNDIACLHSDGNYIAVHLSDHSKVLVRSSLPDLLQQLDPLHFIRVHRSYAINIRMVDTVLPDEIKLKTMVVPFAKSYKEELFKALRINE
jgi:DNA-binding LytR/AlgR family response regulator